MSRLITALVLMSTIWISVACRRTHTCRCILSDSQGNTLQVYERTITGMGKKKARDACSIPEGVTDESGNQWTCALVE